MLCLWKSAGPTSRFPKPVLVWTLTQGFDKTFGNAKVTHKWTSVPDDYEEIYQQMLTEMQQPDFVATWTLLTAWGTRSPDFYKAK